MSSKVRWLVILTLASVLWFAAGYNTASPGGRPTYAILRVDRERGGWEVTGWPLASHQQARSWVSNQGDPGSIYHVARICTETYLRGGQMDEICCPEITGEPAGSWTFPAVATGDSPGAGLRRPPKTDPAGAGVSN
mgnify:CR=1 FL=1